jgi:hypothetical protein
VTTYRYQYVVFVARGLSVNDDGATPFPRPLCLLTVVGELNPEVTSR